MLTTKKTITNTNDDDNTKKEEILKKIKIREEAEEAENENSDDSQQINELIALESVIQALKCDTLDYSKFILDNPNFYMEDYDESYYNISLECDKVIKDVIRYLKKKVNTL